MKSLQPEESHSMHPIGSALLSLKLTLPGLVCQFLEICPTFKVRQFLHTGQYISLKQSIQAGDLAQW